jgi:hypothetical protein
LAASRTRVGENSETGIEKYFNAPSPAEPIRRLRGLPPAVQTETHFGFGGTAGLVKETTSMIEIFQVALNLQRFCQKHRWKFCFIGGIALQRWGEPRVTQDVDVSILTGVGEEEKFIRLLESQFSARIARAEEFALRHRVLLLRSQTGVGIDISLAMTGFEETVIDRATLFTFLPRIRLLTCSAEDLIVYKAFADRTRDWLDVETIIGRQAVPLDWKYIKRYLSELVRLKEAPHILEQLNQLRLKQSKHNHH